MDENAHKPFWVSWEEGRIRVGSGLSNGVKPLVTCTPTSVLTVSALAIDSGDQTPATWLFNSAKGDSFLHV